MVEELQHCAHQYESTLVNLAEQLELQDRKARSYSTQSHSELRSVAGLAVQQGAPLLQVLGQLLDQLSAVSPDQLPDADFNALPDGGITKLAARREEPTSVSQSSETMQLGLESESLSRLSIAPPTSRTTSSLSNQEMRQPFLGCQPSRTATSSIASTDASSHMSH